MGEKPSIWRRLRERLLPYFAAPEYEEETDRLAAEAINLALWMGTFLLAVLVVWQQFFDSRPSNLMYVDQIAGFGILVLGHWLLRHGWLRQVGVVSVGLGWLLMTADILLREGLYSPNVAAEAILIFVAGLLVSSRFAMALAGLTIAANFLAAMGQLRGDLPNLGAGPEPLSRWFVLSIYIVLAAFFVTLFRGFLDANIRRSEMGDRLYQALLRSTSEAVVLIDNLGIIRHINQRGCDLLGRQKDEILGLDYRLLVAARFHPLLDRLLPRAFAGQAMPTYEIELVSEDGALIPVEVSSGMVQDADEQPILIQNILRDVSERKRIERELTYHATHDRLTGLLNRNQFEENLKRAVSRAGRERSRLALLFIDLDDLKTVNDDFGHAAGDELIRTAALRLAMAVRTGDVLARQSGDEFVVLLEPLRELAAVEALAGRILTKIAQPMEIGGQAVRTSCSIGVSIFPQNAKDADTLMQVADMAMYAAKRAGKNRMHMYEEADWEESNRGDWRPLDRESDDEADEDQT